MEYFKGRIKLKKKKNCKNTLYEWSVCLDDKKYIIKLYLFN